MPRKLLAIFAVLVVWAAWFVYRSSFVVDGVRYFSLFDDAMISMVYARNLLEGFGLNWARWGDPVEGYTCPLWTFLMIPVNALPLPLAKRSLVVQILSLGFLLANLAAVRHLLLAHFTAPRARHWLPAVVLTAAYFPLNHWALVGMETALLALLIALAVHLTLRVAHDGADAFLALFCVLAAALLVRPDMALLVAACLAASWRALARAPLARWLPGLAVLVVSQGAYLLFRLWYFGDLLPNTYYLKLTGTPVHVRIAHGFLDFLDFARPVGVPLVLVAVGLGPLLATRPRARLPLAVILLYFAYSIYVGSDVYDYATASNRFVAPVMPLLFVLIGMLLNEALSIAAPRLAPAAYRTASFYALVGATVLGVLWFNGLLAEQTRRQWESFVVLNRPIHTATNERLVHNMRRLRELVSDEALVAVTWAGVTAYFTDFRMADWLGYSDSRIARMESVSTLTLDTARHFAPGHMKYDYDYMLDELKADVVFLDGNLESGLRERAHDYEQVERVFWLRRDSDALREAGLELVGRGTEKPAGG